MSITDTGFVDFKGPVNLTGQAIIHNERLMIRGPSIELDCGIMNEALTCHAHFDWWFAELNLRKPYNPPSAFPADYLAATSKK